MVGTVHVQDKDGKPVLGADVSSPSQSALFGLEQYGGFSGTTDGRGDYQVADPGLLSFLGVNSSFPVTVTYGTGAAAVAGEATWYLDIWGNWSPQVLTITLDTTPAQLPPPPNPLSPPGVFPPVSGKTIATVGIIGLVGVGALVLLTQPSARSAASRGVDYGGRLIKRTITETEAEPEFSGG